MTRLKDLEEERSKRRKEIFDSLIRYSPYVIAFIAGYRLIGIGFGEMQQWDESIYALRTLAVWKFGAVWDQASVMLRGVYYSAHPPLYVWASTITSVLFGLEYWVFRLPSALAGGVCVALLYRMARLYLNKPFSLVASGLLGFAPLFTFFSRQGQLDILLLVTMLGALYSSVLFIQEGKSRHLFLSGFLLGLALMTKLLFALSIPLALMIAQFFLSKGQRTRCVKTAILSLLISLPFWTPWVIAFTLRHSGGDPYFLFSDGMPFGKTLAGLEGTTKELGKWYYLNQLIVNLSFLFPPFIIGAIRSFRRMNEDAGLIVLSVFAVTYLAIIWLMGSSFEVYLLQVIPVAIVLAVVTLQQAQHWHPLEQSWTLIASILCLAWSLAGWMRTAVKEALSEFFTFALPSVDVLLLSGIPLVLFIAGLYIVRKAYREYWIALLFTPRTFATLTACLALATMFRIWIVHPGEYTDGASAVVQRLNALPVRHVAFVGNGDNPQLTFYLEGEDIGWPSERARTFVRYEPSFLGAEIIATKLEQRTRTDSVAVIVEKDEIAVGVYRSADDVLPRGRIVILDERRYTLVLLPKRPS